MCVPETSSNNLKTKIIRVKDSSVKSNGKHTGIKPCSCNILGGSPTWWRKETITQESSDNTSVDRLCSEQPGVTLVELDHHRQ
ncbi:unnamed protein product [Leptidea sinapis]|uniref:Uncharacterized protein n=1 Tax=Leptidea sinapis TaxID=189913 RepID=A0A5E4R023_9NEOP|nr:unnamed protein product [Leptidea sinapis]